jgi:MtN3 and saliva related transmembrane protein
MDMFFDILQLAGGFILAFGNIPQILQILRTKSAVDLNLKTYILMIIGVSMMEIYAINLVAHGSGGAFLATNTLSFAALVVMIVLILKYGKRVEDKKISQDQNER